jgi:IclR family transcriptional regulator, acetate operon repressor
VESVDRMTAILRHFALAPTGRRGVSEIARATGLSKAVVHRMLLAMAHSGLLVRDEDDQRYDLGPLALGLGMAAMAGHDLARLAAPIMKRLVETTGETSTLSMRVGDERVYEAQVEPAQDVRMIVGIGERYPLYLGSSGRAMLAFLPSSEIDAYLKRTRPKAMTPATKINRAELLAELAITRERGYAMSFGERDTWAAGVATPIRDVNSTVVGAISICGPSFRIDEPTARRYGELVRKAADELSPRVFLPTP